MSHSNAGNISGVPELHYHVIRPATIAAPGIWYLEAPPSSRPIVFLPDGCVEIVLTAGRERDGALIGSRGSWVVGQATTATWFHPREPIVMLGVRLSPPWACALLQCEQQILTDKRIALADVSPPLAKQLEALVDDAVSPGPAAIAMCTAIENRAIRWVDAHMIQLLNAFSTASGGLPVNALARASGLSVRQLERRFGAEVGLSPKVFGRVLRFSRLIGAMAASRHRNALDLAVEHGYFDHAHVARDASTLAGQSLRTLLNEPRLIVGTSTLQGRSSI